MWGISLPWEWFSDSKKNSVVQILDDLSSYNQPDFNISINIGNEDCLIL